MILHLGNTKGNGYKKYKCLIAQEGINNVDKPLGIGDRKMKASLPIKFTPAKETTITVASVINDCRDVASEECPLYVYDTASGNRFAVTSVDTSLNGIVDINICLGTQKNQKRTWRIKYVGDNQEDDPLYWSNIEGFCSCCYTLFTEDEHNTFDLPVDGEWEVVCDYPRTVMEFFIDLEAVTVIIHHILTDEERQKIA